MILNCYFCQKEFVQEWTPLGNKGLQIPMLFKCEEHSPGITFSRGDRFIMDYKGLIFAADITNKMIEVVKYLKIEGRTKRHVIMNCDLPETKDLKEFAIFLDRLLELKAFS